MMKHCGACGLTKPLEEFHYKNRTVGTRSAKCMSCSKAYQRAWYAENREGHGLRSKVRRMCGVPAWCDWSKTPRPYHALIVTSATRATSWTSITFMARSSPTSPI